MIWRLTERACVSGAVALKIITASQGREPVANGPWITRTRLRLPPERERIAHGAVSFCSPSSACQLSISDPSCLNVPLCSVPSSPPLHTCLGDLSVELPPPRFCVRIARSTFPTHGGPSDVHNTRDACHHAAAPAIEASTLSPIRPRCFGSHRNPPCKPLSALPCTLIDAEALPLQELHCPRAAYYPTDLDFTCPSLYPNYVRREF